MADENEFEPHLGRMRATGGKRARKYVGRVLAAGTPADIRVHKEVVSAYLGG